MRDFKTGGVTEEDALRGNSKAFVHKYRICQGLMAQVSPARNWKLALLAWKLTAGRCSCLSVTPSLSYK